MSYDVRLTLEDMMSKRWGRYVNPNTRRGYKMKPEFFGDRLWTPGRRGTSHAKTYYIDWKTWYIFIWLLTQTVSHHPKPFNKTDAGRRRRAERRFKQEQRCEERFAD